MKYAKEDNQTYVKNQCQNNSVQVDVQKVNTRIRIYR